MMLCYVTCSLDALPFVVGGLTAPNNGALPIAVVIGNGDDRTYFPRLRVFGMDLEPAGILPKGMLYVTTCLLHWRYHA